RRGQRVRGEVRDGDVDGRVRFRACEEPELPQLLVGFESVTALHLDRGGAELDGVTDAAPQEREQLVVARIARRADGRVDAVAGGGPDARALLLERRNREQSRAVKDEVRRGHSRKWLSITRSRVKASSFSESAATCRTASNGIRPMSSPRSTFTPAALARASTSRHPVASA